MKGTVKKVSDFLATSRWLFVFEDQKGTEYLVLPEKKYVEIGLKSPVTFRDLDSLSVGMNVFFEYIESDNLNIVTSFSWEIS